MIGLMDIPIIVVVFVVSEFVVNNNDDDVVDDDENANSHDKNCDKNCDFNCIIQAAGDIVTVVGEDDVIIACDDVVFVETVVDTGGIMVEKVVGFMIRNNG
jgi:hypothetical protein